MDWDGIRTYFSEAGLMPHGHCYHWRGGLVWTHVVSDALIGLAYLLISVTLYGLVKRIKLPFSAVVLSFGAFIGACGATHFMEIWTLWTPNYWASGLVKLATAAASVATGAWLLKLRHPIVAVAEAAKLAERRRLDLEALAKTLEERVAERTRELQSAVASRDDFLSIASHELKTPLTSLKLQTQMARRALLGGKDAAPLTTQQSRKLIDQYERQIERLSRLVEDMLDISRISTGRLSIVPQPSNLSELIGETCERMAPILAASGCALRTEIVPGIRGSVDRVRVEQSLINLLTNASKYGEGKPVRVRLWSDGEIALIRVTDQGRGIAPEDQKRIFGRYERAISADEVSGMGLGLFIARQIAELHGGTIEVESAVGQGASFTLCLPLKGGA